MERSDFQDAFPLCGQEAAAKAQAQVICAVKRRADAFLNFEFIETQTPCAPEAEGCERASISENFYRGSPMKSSLSLSLSLSLLSKKRIFFETGNSFKAWAVFLHGRQPASSCPEGGSLFL